MNKITKKECEAIQVVADGMIRLNDDGTDNKQSVVEFLLAEFDISRDRAKNHAAKAVRRIRHPNWGGRRSGQTGRPKLPPREDGRELYRIAVWLTKREKASILAATNANERRDPLLTLVLEKVLDA